MKQCRLGGSGAIPLDLEHSACPPDQGLFGIRARKAIEGGQRLIETPATLCYLGAASARRMVGDLPSASVARIASASSSARRECRLRLKRTRGRCALGPGSGALAVFRGGSIDNKTPSQLCPRRRGPARHLRTRQGFANGGSSPRIMSSVGRAFCMRVSDQCVPCSVLRFRQDTKFC